MRERRAVALATLVLLAVAALVYGDYGITWDESVDHFRRRAGELTWSFWFNGHKAEDALFDYGHNPTTSFVYYAVARGLWGLGATIALPELWHLLTAGIAVGAVPLTYWLARRLAEPPWAAVAALGVLLAPRFVGHAFGNFKDVPFTTAWLGAVLTLVRAVEVPSSGRILQHGLALGALLVVRIGGLLFFPVSLVGLLLAVRHAAPSARGRLVAVGALAVLLSLVVHALSYPYVLLRPVDGLLELVRANQAFEWGGTTLTLGLEHSSLATPRWYIPVWLGVTLPELVLVGLGLFVVTAHLPAGALALWRDPERAAPLVLTTLAALWPLAYLIVSGAPVYDGTRHFLFVTPLLAVLAALGLRAAYAQASARWARRAWVVALGAAAALQVVELVRYHPFQVVWFNSLTAGAAGAQGHFTLDYWGSTSRASSQWLAAHGEAGEVCLIGSIEESWQYYLRPPWSVVTALQLAACPSSARYAYATSRNNDLAASSQQAAASRRWAPLHSVERAGATLGTWYERVRPGARP